MATPLTKHLQPQAHPQPQPHPHPHSGMNTYRNRETCQIQGSSPNSSHHNSNLSRRQSNSRSSYRNINHNCSTS
jgi:hypothetical protein